MPSQTKENYLKAMFFLARNNKEITLSDLSKEMGVSIPTVNSMVKKLQEMNWVVYKKYKPLQFTESGKKVAANIIRKHRLAEMYLVEKMGFGWEEVHDIAEEMEHINSTALFDKMDELLGFPKIDPHGSPIPDKEGNVVFKAYQKLSDIEEGGNVKLCAITNSSNEFLEYLNNKTLELGTRITVHKIEAFDKSMTVSYGPHTNIMLSKEVCERLLVEEV